MKKFNWGNVFETIAYLGIMAVGFGILYQGFIFIYEIIKSIF